MKTICVTALSVMLVTAFCGGAFGSDYCRPTGELQEKAQALADLAVKEGLQGALQFCAYKDGKCTGGSLRLVKKEKRFARQNGRVRVCGKLFGNWLG